MDALPQEDTIPGDSPTQLKQLIVVVVVYIQFAFQRGFYWRW